MAAQSLERDVGACCVKHAQKLRYNLPTGVSSHRIVLASRHIMMLDVTLVPHFVQYAQKLRYYLPALKEKGVAISLVGIGGFEAGTWVPPKLYS